MDSFNMTKYWHQYQEATTRLGVLGKRIDDMRAALIYAEDMDVALAEVEAAEAEYQALKAEVDDLRCLASTGRHRDEWDRANTVQFRRL